MEFNNTDSGITAAQFDIIKEQLKNGTLVEYGGNNDDKIDPKERVWVVTHPTTGEVLRVRSDSRVLFPDKAFGCSNAGEVFVVNPKYINTINSVDPLACLFPSAATDQSK